MEYINKDLQRPTAHQIIRDFLTSKWQPETSCYNKISYSYDEFWKFFKPQLLDAIRQNQSNYCCYCLRLLNTGNTTLEHIIPRSASNSEFQNYASDFGNNYSFICHQSIFTSTTTQLNVPPFPHEISYENLVASCDGRLPINHSIKNCCNHARGTIKIIPVFYSEHLVDCIYYKSNGEVSLKDTTKIALLLNFINATKLNIDILKSIRKLWYHLREISLHEILKLSNATEDERSTFLAKKLISITDINDIVSLINNFKLPIYWESFIAYQWFHSYYNHPKPLN